MGHGSDFDQQHQHVDEQINAGGDAVGGDKHVTINHNYYGQDNPVPQPANPHDQLAQLPLDVLPEPAPIPPHSYPLYGRNLRFAGRKAQLRAIARAINQAPTTPIAITGVAGIGKSQLAVEFVHRYGRYFAGGVYWVSMAQAASVPNEVALCGQWMKLEDYEGLPLPEQVVRVKREWQEKIPRLLIFDNCEDEQLLADWRPTTGDCVVVLTSQNALWEGVHQIKLEELSPQEGLELLQRFVPHIDRDEAEQLTAVLHGSPLALHLIGSTLKRYAGLSSGSAAQLLRQLQNEGIQHPALQPHPHQHPNPTGHEWSVVRTFDLVYGKLGDGAPDPLARALLARAAHFAPSEPIPRRLLWQTVGDETAEEMTLQDATLHLCQLGLLEGDEPATAPVQLHGLLAHYVRGVTDSAAAQAAVEKALLTEVHRLNEAGDPRPLQAWVVHLQHLTNCALERGDERATVLANNLGYHFREMGNLEAACRYVEQALALRRDLLGERHPGTAHSLNNLGVLLQDMGDPKAARPYLEQALAIRREVLGERHSDTASSLNNFGTLLDDMGEYESARRYYEQALAIRRDLLGKHHPHTALSLNNLGTLLHEMGDYEAACRHYEEALAIRRKVLVEHHPHTALSLNNLGMLLKKMDEYGVARRYYEQALEIWREVLGEHHPDTASSLNNLGSLLQDMGDPKAARAHYKQALAILEEKLGHDHPHTRLVRGNLQALDKGT